MTPSVRPSINHHSPKSTAPLPPATSLILNLFTFNRPWSAIGRGAAVLGGTAGLGCAASCARSARTSAANGLSISAPQLRQSLGLSADADLHFLCTGLPQSG